MKTALVILVSFAAVSCAQDRKPADESHSQEKKRLQSVTWDLKTHKLIWVVQRGSEEHGDFKATGSDSYEITPDEAVMAFEDHRRGFTKEEATSLHRLLDTLSLYCAESVIWWNQGQGEPLDGKPAAKPSDKSEPKKQRVDEKSEPNRPRHIDGKQLVALSAETR